MWSDQRTEALTRQFYAWELRGRGWARYEYPVALEPPFEPFHSHHVPTAVVDDGRHPTFLSSLVERFLPSQEAPREEPQEALELSPDPDFGWDDEREFLIALPSGTKVARGPILGFLRSLATARERIAFEILGAERRVEIRLAMGASDAQNVLAQLKAAVPGAIILSARETLTERWDQVSGGSSAALECGLASEFMVPLAYRASDEPLLPVIAALSEIGESDLGLVQVLFEPARNPWAASILRAVVTDRGEPFFADAPEVTSLAKEKVSSPLFAVLLRVAGRAAHSSGAWEVVRRVCGALANFGSPLSNEFMPLPLEDSELLLRDILLRSTHRSGMLLSAEELASLIQLPGAAVAIPELWRGGERSKQAPAEVGGTGTLLGRNVHGGEEAEVRLPVEAKTKHVHVVGGSGTGKSTLLARMILADIEAGHGVGVLDPHGDLVDEVAARVPLNRQDEVIFFDPADERAAVGWNILRAHSTAEREMLSSDLVAVFRRLSTSWGDQMTAVLGNAILVFLERESGGTLLDLRRFLIEEPFRQQMLAGVEDPYLRSFWQVEFPLLVGRRPQAPILTRLDMFLRSKLVRRVVTAGDEGLDFREVTDRGLIFLGKLSAGAIGEENAALLGSLVVSKFHQVTLAREAQAASARRPFFLYIDEFHEVATPSMASLFSGARKYGLGLTVAHQDLYQLHRTIPEVERSLLGNAYTRICFRVGEEDARSLERGMSFFTAEDLLRLRVGEAICRVGGREGDFNLSVERLPAINPAEARERREALREQSARRFARQTAETGPTTKEATEPLEGVPAPTGPAPHTRPLTPQEEPAKTPQAPTPEVSVDKLALDYLALVAASPFLTVRERNEKLGLSAWRGHRVKGALIRDGLASEVAINPGGRGERFKLLDLTPEGRALLSRFGVALPRGYGRGGIAHQWWARRVSEWLSRHGVVSEIEDGSSGARADLTCHLGAERVALEIELLRGPRPGERQEGSCCGL